MIDLDWPVEASEDLRAVVHRVLHDVVADGGAVGYPDPPARAETDAWLDDVLADTRRRDGAIVLARVDGVVQAMGTWRRERSPVFRTSAEVAKVMAHPVARGLGLGRRVVSALVDDAGKAGLELLTLGVRGNNHGASQLYEELGFREYGRLPNRIVVGDDRFDDVKMMLLLGYAPGVRLRGAEPGGPGSTPPRRATAGPARS
ncbi:GNAT family N-acetyltransferase [Actinophytocola algeriensis]|uniref:Ribosomal protein S18 acetylase RimI-like enzyme n=1 Tax=Actinophytocola algeriensis TaxID=1768010 RepID=A0A7W7VC68_9PSEU|nr:GNAT family N-acetyltransferase [Actinophytocola algeriensis]MBB4904756.1 ribosomal protein S18 acetylase RimI-like enzyme [Actinophytocola algeriensis]MBE1476385.1 ribosomal protein S18 acetylase RimI-like enzyme [Actinophytocola algeriensis]